MKFVDFTGSDQHCNFNPGLIRSKRGMSYAMSYVFAYHEKKCPKIALRVHILGTIVKNYRHKCPKKVVGFKKGASFLIIFELF